MPKLPIHAVLFDLDGTLMDTAPDLAEALNIQLTLHGKQRLDFELIRPHVSHGAGALIKLGFQLDASHSAFESMRQQFLEIYQDNIHVKTVLFQGMDSLLTQLEQKQIPWGIVTNKPAFLTDVLLQRMGYHTRSGVTVSGDTLPVRKPDPAPLLHAAATLSCTPEHCIYVGDAVRDIEAARAANMYSIAAGYGYIGAEPPIEQWQAHHIVHDVDELSQAIFGFID